MTRIAKAGGVVAALVVVAVVLAARRTGDDLGGGGAAPPAPAAVRQLPRLVDVGADKCIPCKAMAPILTQLRADYARISSRDMNPRWRASSRPSGPKKIWVGIIRTP